MGKIVKDFDTMLVDMENFSDRERIRSANLSEAEKQFYFAVSDVVSFMFEIFDADAEPGKVEKDIVAYAERAISIMKQKILLETDEGKREELTHFKNGFIAAKNLMFKPDDKLDTR